MFFHRKPVHSAGIFIVNIVHHLFDHQYPEPAYAAVTCLKGSVRVGPRKRIERNSAVFQRDDADGSAGFIQHVNADGCLTVGIRKSIARNVDESLFHANVYRHLRTHGAARSLEIRVNKAEDLVKLILLRFE